jgi:hypothetical protein
MRWWLAPFLCLAAGSAAAQPVETVVVKASTLAGIWKITRPDYVMKDSFFGALKWGPMRDTYCRLEQTGSDLTGHCLPGGGAWTMSMEASHIHLAFGTMLARVILDGALQSGTHFSGTYTLKISGIPFDDPTPSQGDKLTVSEAAPDNGGKAALLRTILTEGIAGVPHDDAAIKANSPKADEALRLGAVQAVAYLGQMAKPQPPDKEGSGLDFFSVYAVEFDSGERICGLHQRADGVLDAFLCL